ncbi:MAG: hypothetical protein RIQ81_1046 [Pseudomonadota bacterium]
MKVQVQLESKLAAAEAKPVVVNLPDHIPANQSFQVEVDGRKYTARFNRTAGTLVLATQDHPACERPVAVRRLNLLRFPGDSEAVCEMECALPCDEGPAVPLSVKATTTRWLPGGSSKMGKATKGLRNPVLRSQITGKVLKVHVAEGVIVDEGAPLMVIEAMKMENRIVAPARVKIAGIKAKEGASVATGEELMRFEPADA